MTVVVRGADWIYRLVQVPISDHCLCPGCYWVATEESELCLRCALEGCDHEVNRHG